MFLSATVKRNPNLILAAARLHAKGMIRPNTFVLDLDAIRKNAHALYEAAQKYQLNLYIMTKQHGRNPVMIQSIREEGLDRFVAVNAEEAFSLHGQSARVAHVGHLSQIPVVDIPAILNMRPEVITVFSLEKAKQISKAAEKVGIVQDLLIRPYREGDFLYPGQQAGIPIDQIIEIGSAILSLPYVRLVGVTSMPCLLYDDKSKRIQPTANLDTILQTADELRKKLGIEVTQINAPSASCVDSFKIIAEKGATHAEPGSSLTAHTPLHAYSYDQPEIPAMVYLSEVSHLMDGGAFTFGGGMYFRGNIRQALIASNPDSILDRVFPVHSSLIGNIDYYGSVEIGNQHVSVGDTAIYAFRSQIFTAQSDVAVVEGISQNQTHLIGIYTSTGYPLPSDRVLEKERKT